MNARRLTILVVLAVAISTTFADDSWVVREDGAGPVRIGMSPPQLNTVLHDKLPLPAAKDAVRAKKQPKLSFMVLEGRLARIDVRAPGPRTTMGIQVGDSEKHAT